MEKLLTIKDQRGNYVSPISFQQPDTDKKGDKWAYVSFTGSCAGVRYYQNEEVAKEVTQQLETKNSKLKANKIFTIVEVDKDTLGKFDGKMLIEDL